MLTEQIGNKALVCWQEFGEDTPGEQAILIRQYTREIEITQMRGIIMISRHELNNFIKALKKTNEL